MRGVLLLVIGSLCLPLFADDAGNRRLMTERRSLSDARSQYRSAVRAHGANSPEAANARMRLRESRRAFHDHRRAMQYH